MNRNPERRHSVELEASEEKDQRPYKYVLKKDRTLFPRPRFHSKYPDAKGISYQQVEFNLRHIVQQRYQEKQQEDLDREKKDSERRRQSKLPKDITSKPKDLFQ